MEEIEQESDLKSNHDVKTGTELCSVYHQAIFKLLDLGDDCNLLYMKRFFRIFLPEVTSWCDFRKTADDNNDLRQLMKDTLYYRLTYVYRNCIILSSAVGFHFQNALMENPGTSERLLQKRALKICSLGGGPASDVVAVTTVLQSLAMEMNKELDICVTIIDIDRRWTNTSISVLTSLEQFRGATWKISFIQADLSKDFSENTIKAIQEADIVTMVMLFSEFVRSENSAEATFHQITDIVQPGAILLALDFPRMDLIKSCGGHTGQMDNFQLLYEELYHFFALQVSVMKELFIMYHKIFSAFRCNNNLDAFVRVWVRKSPKKRKLLKNRVGGNRQQQDSLHANYYFKNWELRFSEEMPKFGWNRRRTKKVISQNQEIRSSLLKQQFEKKRLADSALKKLATENDLLDTDEQPEMDEDAWKKYFVAKRNTALVERKMHSVSMFNMQCNFKRSILGSAAPKTKTKKRS